ncbi:MAG: DUF523 domain-containing protein [Calditrichaeota bacterium]|nr:DUF523 domain-containing protein [Calditrichota bacterium]RQW00540.1 MAG: DUF523 domain-containing protein [Calditrichota bacterium]
MEKILISACLIGKNVRYDGENVKLKSSIIERWLTEDRLVPVCPEVEGGLAVPRPPAEIVWGSGEDILDGKSLIRNRAGKDVTEYYLRGSQTGLETARRNHIKIAVLKTRSPACGLYEIYDGSFSRNLKPGKGVFTALLIRHGIKIFTESELNEALEYLRVLEVRKIHKKQYEI